MIVFHGLSDIGLKRSVNEDSFHAGFNQNKQFLAVVCDGVAGSNAGDIASKTAVESLFNQFNQLSLFKNALEVKKWIYTACQNANDFIIDRSKKDNNYKGMATTIVGALICEVGTFIFNIGDSRVYGLFDKFVCLTNDHNYDRFIKEKKTDIPIDLSTKKDALTNALGIYNVIEVDIIKIKETWKKILLCSDGLHNYVSAQDLYDIITEKNSPDEKCIELVNIAKKNSGKDNITAIMVERRNRYGKSN